MLETWVMRESGAGLSESVWRRWLVPGEWHGNRGDAFIGHREAIRCYGGL